MRPPEHPRSMAPGWGGRGIVSDRTVLGGLAGRVGRLVEGHWPSGLLSWQADFLNAVEDPKCQVGVLSMGRGSGKSALVSAIAAALLEDGDENVEVISVSASISQSELLLRDVMMFLNIDELDARQRIHPARRDRWYLGSKPLRLRHLSRGVVMRCVSSKPSGLHGQRPSHLLIDEPAQWDVRAGLRLWSAAMSSLGKRSKAQCFVLGTRAAARDHFYEELLRTADDDESIVARVFSAHPRDAIGDPRSWHAALPGLADDVPRLDVVRGEAERALRSSALEAAFRALRLNAGTADSVTGLSPLLDAAEWLGLDDGEGWERRGLPVVGLDLGQRSAGAVAIFPSGRVETVAVMADVDLERLERGDGAPPGVYSMARQHGHLVVLEGDSNVSAEGLVRVAHARWPTIRMAVSDRYRRGSVEDAVRDVWGVSLIARSMAGMDLADDIYRARLTVALGLIAPVANPMLDVSLSRTQTRLTVAGNERLVKSGIGGRRSTNDVACAWLLAAAHHHRLNHAPSGPGGVLMVGGKEIRV